jgi:hypothetical protein
MKLREKSIITLEQFDEKREELLSVCNVVGEPDRELN